MKAKHLILCLAGLGAAIAAVIVVNKETSDQVDDQVGKKLYTDFKTDAVSTIVLNSGKEEVTLELKAGKWGVKGRDGFSANFDNIDTLVKRVADLKVLNVRVGVKQENLGNFKLLAPGNGGSDDQTGTSVVLKDSDGKELANLVVGKAPPNGSGGGFGGGTGQYIQLNSAPTKAYVVKTGFDYFISDITNKAWLDKTTLFKPEKHKSVTLTSGTAADDWRLYREKEGTDAAEIKLADAKPGEEFDTSKASGSAAALGGFSFNDIAVGDEKGKAGLDKPSRTVIIETFDGFKYTVKIGNQVPAAEGDTAAAGNEEYYVSADIEGTFSETAPEWKPSAEDEKKSEDDKKKLKEAADTAFQTELKTKKDRLAKEKALAGHVFKVAKYVVDPLLKTRKDLMKDKAAEGAPATAPGDPSTPIQNLPPAPVANAMPAGKPAPISATTPPIAVDVKDGKAVATPVSPEELKAAEEAAKKKAAESAPK
jgi:hypothetical protein